MQEFVGRKAAAVAAPHRRRVCRAQVVFGEQVPAGDERSLDVREPVDRAVEADRHHRVPVGREHVGGNVRLDGVAAVRDAAPGRAFSREIRSPSRDWSMASTV